MKFIAQDHDIRESRIRGSTDEYTEPYEARLPRYSCYPQSVMPYRAELRKELVSAIGIGHFEMALPVGRCAGSLEYEVLSGLLARTRI